MKNLLNKIWNKEEGFTLIELIIVIAILAIIAAIAIPNVLSAVDNSRKTTDISNAKLIADAAATVRAQEDTHAGYHSTTNLASPDAFGAAVVKQLNGVAPTIKYKGNGVDLANYVVDVAADGSITVYASTATTNATTAYILFPTVHADFQ